MEPAFEYAEPLEYTLTRDGKSKTRRGRKVDQFAAELLYFSDCILKDREPEPSAEEGAWDLRIIDALYESARLGEPIALPDRLMRIRKLTIEPGGIVPWHSHADRPALILIVEGEINVRGRDYPLRAMATQVFRSEGIEGEAPRIGAGAGVGAIVGGIIGGLRGALVGVLIGAGGTIAATVTVRPSRKPNSTTSTSTPPSSKAKFRL